MRNLKLLAVAALLLAPLVLGVTPSGLHAQTVSGQVKWVGVGNSFPWWWRADDPAHPTQQINTHAYGGAAYSADLKFTSSVPSGVTWPAHGTTNFGPAVDIYCIDYTHTANTGTYNAYFTKLTGPLTNTRQNSQAKYLEVAWLATKMETYGLTSTADKTSRAEIHAAMWWILSGEPKGSWNGLNTNNGTSNPANYLTIGSSDYWVTQAQHNYGSIDGSEWTVITDACVTSNYDNGKGEGAKDTCSQEFLTHNPPGVVAEPATMLLLGTGLLATLAMSGMLRRPQG